MKKSFALSGFVEECCIVGMYQLEIVLVVAVLCRHVFRPEKREDVIFSEQLGIVIVATPIQWACGIDGSAQFSVSCVVRRSSIS